MFPRLGRSGWPWLAVSLVLIALVSVAVLKSISSRRAIRVELARIHAAGEPTDLHELDEFYRRPATGHDATQLILDGVSLILAIPRTQTQHLPCVGESRVDQILSQLPWDGLAEAKIFLKRYQKPLEMLHQAAELGGEARHPIKFDRYYNRPHDHANGLRAGARFLALDALVHALDGDPERARASLSVMFALARSLENEPTMLSFLIRMAIDRTTRIHLGELLPVADFTEDQLVEMQTTLRDIDYTDGLRRALVGERAMGIATLQNPNMGGLTGTQALRIWFTAKSDFLLYLNSMSGLVDATQKPWPLALQESATAQAISTGNRTLFELGDMGTRMIGAPAKVFRSAARETALNDAADTALAIERFRKRHGRLPVRLDQLVPDLVPRVPIDPFDAKPLRYSSTVDGYVIYSVGANRVDDGAVEKDQLDHAFRVQLPRSGEK